MVRWGGMWSAMGHGAELSPDGAKKVVVLRNGTTRRLGLAKHHVTLPPSSSAVGILPFKAIQTGRLTMGYTVVETTPECWLFPPGMTLRGHVFHFSKIIEVRRAMQLAGTCRGDALMPRVFHGLAFVLRGRRLPRAVQSMFTSLAASHLPTLHMQEHVLAGPVGSPPITDAGPGGWSAPWFSSYMVRPQIPGAKEVGIADWRLRVAELEGRA